MNPFGLAAVLALALAAAPAAAVTSVHFTAVGQTSTIKFNGLMDAYLAGGSSVPGLGASLDLTLTALQGSSATFAYALTNMSSQPIQASQIMLFGFDTSPLLASASATGAFASVKSGSLPNVGGVQRSVDVCFRAGPRGASCTAVGSNGGVALGGTGSGMLTLNFHQPLGPGGVTLSDFHVRYQGIDSAALGFAGGSGVGVPIEPGAVPEPGTWALLIAGFGLVGAALRRRRVSSATAAA